MEFKKLIIDVNNWNDLDIKIKSLPSTTQMGDAFELLTKYYFQINPKLKVKFQEVWLQNEIPVTIKKTLGLPIKDLGFDLLVKSDNQYYPVQCKYHSDFKRNITFQEVSTFLALYESNSKLSKAFITSTAGDVSNNYKKVVNKPIQLILYDTWQSLDKTFFDQLRNKLNNKSYSPEPYYPRKHQEKALKDSKEYFINNNNSKGKLIFPCGAGKSLTGFWMSQELGSKTTLIAVPSLSLIKQTLDVYLKEFVARDIKVKFLCICSDEGIGKNDDIAFKTENIGVPCDTDPVFIKQWLKDNRKENIVVFTTYQSGRIIAELSKELKLSFDVGIFDEAHKTVGSSKKLFSHLLFDENISVEKRVYMTATERFYSGSKDDMISMDNEDIYGETFSFMSFKDAINEKLLTDYKIITIDVKKSEIAEFIKSNRLVQLSDKWKKETEARSISSMIALRKAMNRFDIKNVVSFHSSIERAKRNMGIHSYITSTYGYKPIDTFTVSGKDSTRKRSEIVKEFASSNKALITNARCLTEGIDVPNIDCIVFADSRKSKVDIVQALGRALRKKEGKDWGYVILPVVYDENTNEIDNDSFEEILSIIRGLAANDERIIEYFKDKNQPNSSNRIEGSDIFQIESELLEEKDLIENLEIKLWDSLSRFTWMSFKESKEYVRKLGITTTGDWKKYVRSGKKPHNLPSKPYREYKEKWLSFPDWFGTKPGFNGTYKSFEEAREYVRKLDFKMTSEFTKYTSSGQLPFDIPVSVANHYKNDGWLSYKDFIGVKPGYIFGKYQEFEDARKLVQNLDLKSQKEWLDFCKSGKKPVDIPSAPNQVYKNEGWVNLGDWLGTGEVAAQHKVFISYKKAKEYVSNLNLKSQKEWNNYKKNNTLPHYIPRTPQSSYKNKGWISWGDFLGTGKVSDNLKMYRSFKDARQFVRRLNLKSQKEWFDFCKSEKKPDDIPKRVNTSLNYRNEWISWGDFLGTGTISYKDLKFLPFNKAKTFVRKLKLKNGNEWSEYCKSGKKPQNIPAGPRAAYKKDGWVNLGDWLGTGRVSNSNIPQLSYKEAKKLISKMKFKNRDEFQNFASKYNHINKTQINLNPHRKFKSQWSGWGDFLGNN
tara:strand:- start:1342 stop:4659 length:3318 start_codon:yes stop_codon:yes gene_type:complete